MPGIKGIQTQRGRTRAPRLFIQKESRDIWLEDQIDVALCSPGQINLGGAFHASSVGNPCDRFLYLHYRGLLPGQEISSQLQRIFDHGNVTQKRYEKYFSQMKFFVASEIRASIENPPIHGKADILLRIPEEGDYIVEAKTINDKGFNALTGPKEEHRIQLQVYLNILGVERGGVLYENKNDQRVVVFSQQKDEALWQGIINRCNRVMGMESLPTIKEMKGIHDERFCDCLRVPDA